MATVQPIYYIKRVNEKEKREDESVTDQGMFPTGEVSSLRSQINVYVIPFQLSKSTNGHVLLMNT